MKFRNQVRRAVCGTTLVLSLFAGQQIQAQLTPRQYAVEATAAITTAPAQVLLQWPADANATGYTVSRKLPNATSWTTLTTLPGGAAGYTDGNVAVGAVFEYRINKASSLGISAFGYVLAGVDAPLVENRGKLILIVDNTQAPPLAAELTRLEQDLAGDGWTVIRKDVSRAATVPSVKGLIKAEYDADRANVKAVFLFGHIPVPRSGDINPDGHDNHKGAWAADTYYADMDGSWTDSSVNDTSAERADNYNTPGDGRFDQGTIPSDLELMVGRVDLSNMTCYANKTLARSETDLLRAYLNKDHNFRHGLMNVPRRGAIADNFGDIYGEAFASIPWANFAAMFGSTNNVPISYGTYFPTLKTQPYLFSYACGGGSYYTCDGIGGSDDFALNDIQAVFTMHFGSYFGDWDNESNFLRAALGSGYVLTTTWSGRPHYFYHHMALGETVGYSVRLSQNNGSGGAYEKVNYGSRFVNSALMGDPTLRLHPVLPPSNLNGIAGSGLILSWTGSNDTAIRGYNVYRSTNASGPFTKLNTSLLATTTFTDAAPLAGGVYMVRAVKLETTPSGTYFNPSQGIFYTNSTDISPTPTVPAAPSNVAATPLNSSQVKLSWADNASNEIEFRIFRKTNSGAYAQIATISANAISYTDSGLAGGTQYTYKVCASNSAGDAYAAQAPIATTAPYAPIRLAVSTDASGQVDFTWVDNSANETGFKVFRRIPGGAYSLIGTTAPNVTRWIDTTAIAGSRYFYTVCASSLSIDSGFSTEVSITAGVPVAPSNLIVTPLNSSQIKLAWTDNASNETGFKILRKTGTGAYAQIAIVNSDSAEYTDTALAGGTQYFYKICAISSAGESAYTDERFTTTAPYAPIKLAALPSSATQVQFSWVDNSSNETGFKVFRRIPGGAYSQIGTTGANATGWLDTTATPTSRYYYTVCASGAVIDSGFYAEVSVTTPAGP